MWCGHYLYLLIMCVCCEGTQPFNPIVISSIYFNPRKNKTKEKIKRENLFESLGVITIRILNRKRGLKKRQRAPVCSITLCDKKFWCATLLALKAQ